MESVARKHSFCETGRVEARFGDLVFHESSDPAALWVTARGFVTPALLRADLARAAEFGTRHAAGWTYIADTTGVSAVHPLNPLVLRRIHELPNLSRYVVLAPSLVTRVMIRMAAWLVKPDAVVATRARALEEIA